MPVLNADKVIASLRGAFAREVGRERAAPDRGGEDPRRRGRPTPRSTSTCSTATSWCSRRTPAATPSTPGSRWARASAAPPWRPGEDQNVPDVRAIENYIACNTWTRSELVVLIRRGDKILGQIDVDSDEPDPFTAEEEAEVREVADALAVLL